MAPPVALLHHLLRHVLAREVGAVLGHLDDLQVVLVVELQHGLAVGDGGAVQEDVDAAVVLDDLLDHVLDVVDLLHLTNDVHALAALLRNLFGHGCGAALLHVEDGDLRALGGEEFGGGAADVPAASDDHCNLAVEPAHVAPSLFRGWGRAPRLAGFYANARRRERAAGTQSRGTDGLG